MPPAENRLAITSEAAARSSANPPSSKLSPPRSGEGDYRLATTYSQFELTAPRHFIYPALLLLLAEQPRHGYRLVDAFLGLGLGPIDRPSVYRALGDLEKDGFITKEVKASTAGSSRHVYSVTESGMGTLRTWTAVLCTQWDSLGQVISRSVVLPMRSAVSNGA